LENIVAIWPFGHFMTIWYIFTRCTKKNLAILVAAIHLGDVCRQKWETKKWRENSTQILHNVFHCNARKYTALIE
jgi:hypothetical protein